MRVVDADYRRTLLRETWQLLPDGWYVELDFRYAGTVGFASSHATSGAHPTLYSVEALSYEASRDQTSMNVPAQTLRLTFVGSYIHATTSEQLGLLRYVDPDESLLGTPCRVYHVQWDAGTHTIDGVGERRTLRFDGRVAVDGMAMAGVNLVQLTVSASGASYWMQWPVDPDVKGVLTEDEFPDVLAYYSDAASWTSSTSPDFGISDSSLRYVYGNEAKVSAIPYRGIFWAFQLAQDIGTGTYRYGAGATIEHYGDWCDHLSPATVRGQYYAPCFLIDPERNVWEQLEGPVHNTGNTFWDLTYTPAGAPGINDIAGHELIGLPSTHALTQELILEVKINTQGAGPPADTYDWRYSDDNGSTWSAWYTNGGGGYTLSAAAGGNNLNDGTGTYYGNFTAGVDNGHTVGDVWQWYAAPVIWTSATSTVHISTRAATAYNFPAGSWVVCASSHDHSFDPSTLPVASDHKIYYYLAEGTLSGHTASYYYDSAGGQIDVTSASAGPQATVAEHLGVDAGLCRKSGAVMSVLELYRNAATALRTDSVISHVDGYTDDGSGTITGKSTGSEIMETPPHVLIHALNTIAGVPMTAFDVQSARDAVRALAVDSGVNIPAAGYATGVGNITLDSAADAAKFSANNLLLIGDKGGACEIIRITGANTNSGVLTVGDRGMYDTVDPGSSWTSVANIYWLPRLAGTIPADSHGGDIVNKICSESGGLHVWWDQTDDGEILRFRAPGQNTNIRVSFSLRGDTSSTIPIIADSWEWNEIGMDAINYPEISWNPRPFTELDLKTGTGKRQARNSDKRRKRGISEWVRFANQKVPLDIDTYFATLRTLYGFTNRYEFEGSLIADQQTAWCLEHYWKAWAKPLRWAKWDAPYSDANLLHRGDYVYVYDLYAHDYPSIGGQGLGTTPVTFVVFLTEDDPKSRTFRFGAIEVDSDYPVL